MAGLQGPNISLICQEIEKCKHPTLKVVLCANLFNSDPILFNLIVSNLI